MASERGEYRAITRVLLDGPEFQALSPAARMVFVWLKVNFGPSGIEVHYPLALDAMLSQQTGLPIERVTSAREELAAADWIRVENNVVWIVLQLKFDPHMSPALETHRKSIQRHVQGLPRLYIVREFIELYDSYFAGVDSPTKGYPVSKPSLAPSLTPSPARHRIPNTDDFNQEDADANASGDAEVLSFPQSEFRAEFEAIPDVPTEAMLSGSGDPNGPKPGIGFYGVDPELERARGIVETAHKLQDVSHVQGLNPRTFAHDQEAIGKQCTPKPEQNSPTDDTEPTRGDLMALVRKHFYGPDGKPPEDHTKSAKNGRYNEAREFSVFAALEKLGYKRSRIATLIEGVAAIRDDGGYVRGDVTRVDWLRKDEKLTMRVLYNSASGVMPIAALAEIKMAELDKAAGKNRKSWDDGKVKISIERTGTK